jgi:hypothetical protein
MAARSEAVITAEASKVVSPFRVSIESTTNPGDVIVPTSTSLAMVVIILLLMCLEVLLNIRQGETA